MYCQLVTYKKHALKAYAPQFNWSTPLSLQYRSCYTTFINLFNRGKVWLQKKKNMSTFHHFIVSAMSIAGHSEVSITNKVLSKHSYCVGKRPRTKLLFSYKRNYSKIVIWPQNSSKKEPKGTLSSDIFPENNTHIFQTTSIVFKRINFPQEIHHCITDVNDHWQANSIYITM